MAVQTVVIDISQTNVKIKSFDKHIDRLGKSFEKLQRQMDRLNQDKRSTGLSLSQGDTLSKSMEKMTDTMTKLFSNGIKINTPTVNAKVTVDFAKMDIAGQVGNAIKSADIAGTILRNIRLPKTGISSASALKMEMPTKMEVEVTNKEIQVKLPKDFLNGGEKDGKKDGKKGLLAGIKDNYNKIKGKYVREEYSGVRVKRYVPGELENGIRKKTENIGENWDFIKSIPKDLKGLRRLPKMLSPVGNLSKSFFKGTEGFTSTKFGKKATGIPLKIGGSFKGLFSDLGGGLKDFGSMVKNSGIGMKVAGFASKAAPVVKGVASIPAGIAMSGFTIFSVALKGLTGIIKGAAGIIKGVVGIFQSIISVASSIWGQVQKWAVNPLVGAQNQMSQNKGYWKLLGGQQGAEILDNKIVDMAVKGPYAYESVEGAVRKLVNTGMSQDKALEVTWNYSNMAAAKSLDEEGMMQGIDSYIQANSGEYVTVDDFNSAANVADPATLAKHLLGVEKAGEKEIEQAKELISTQSISKEKFIDAIGKMGNEYIGLSKEFGGGYESMAEEVASTTYSGITTKIKNIFQGDIVRKWGTGLSDGLAEGLGKFASWLDENRVKFAAWGEQLKSIGREIGQYITNFLQNTGERIKSVFNSTEFQQADLSDKIVIFWDKVIKDPFTSWWSVTGKGFFETAFENLGNTVGGILSGVINGFLGSNPTDAVGEGYNLGFKFAAGFMKGFDLTGLLGNIGKTVIKIGWDFSLGLVVNPFVGWLRDIMGEREKPKALENSKYNEGVQFYEGYEDTSSTKQYKNSGGIRGLMYEQNEETKAAAAEDSRKAGIRMESVKWAKEIEYDRADIKGYREKNDLSDKLYMDANNATWEYENNKKLKDEALANGDKEGANIAEMKMIAAQNELNAATKELHNLYPGIIDAEGMALEVMQKRLDKQKEINEEIRRGKIIQMKNDLAVKEKQLDSHLIMAENDEKAMNEAQLKYEQFNDNASNIVDDFMNWNELNQKGKNGGDKGKAETAKQGLTDKLTAMGFDKNEIKGIFKSEEKNGYTGEALGEMVKTKGAELNEELRKATELYNASMSVLQEILTAKDELAVDKIQELTGLSPEELMQGDNWGNLDPKIQENVLGIIGDVGTLADKFEGLDMDPIHKEIFLDILETYNGKPVGEGGQPTTGGTGGQPTTPTSTTGGAKIWTIQDTINALGFGTNDKKANGDILTSPHIALVAEAGPEAIIPLSKGRRARGLELWEQAGAMMGVYPHADGGMFGSFAAPKQVSPLYQQMEESKESSEQAENEMGAPARVDIGGINVSLGGFTFYGTEANSREGIMSVIKEQMPDIADEIAGTIAVNIQRIFANMKLQTA